MQQTAEEARRERIAVMGESLGSQYDGLWQQLVFAKKKWGEFVCLFGTNEQRVDLLNAAAPSFFHLLQDIMWEDVVLHIARLTDKVRSFGRQTLANMSLRTLPDLVNITARAEVEERVRAAVDATEFARDWRNRHIAHRDLQLALDRNVQPLAFASRACVNIAFEKMQEAMNTVQRHYFDSETHYDVPSSHGGAMNLLYVLHYGVQIMAERKERLARGEWNWEKDRLPKL